jgi:hypothetical protein
MMIIQKSYKRLLLVKKEVKKMDEFSIEEIEDVSPKHPSCIVSGVERV